MMYDTTNATTPLLSAQNVDHIERVRAAARAHFGSDINPLPWVTEKDETEPVKAATTEEAKSEVPPREASILNNVVDEAVASGEKNVAEVVDAAQKVVDEEKKTGLKRVNSDVAHEAAKCAKMDVEEPQTPRPKNCIVVHEPALVLGLGAAWGKPVRLLLGKVVAL
jgi:hypothetical protein